MTSGSVTFTVAGQSASASYTVGAPQSGPILGMNFEPAGSVATFNAPYEPKAKIARIYVTVGQTDITKEDEFVRAADLGIRKCALSWKDTSTTAPAQCMASIPAEFQWYGINHHEPEDDIASGGFTLAQWQTWQAQHLPLIRAKGGTPAICLMSYTVNPVSGRRVTDYKLPTGLADLPFWDYYPNKESKPTQAQTVARIKAGNAALGYSRYGFGEYGIVNGSPTFTAATVTEFKGLISDAEAACYWSNQQAENQKFTPAVATAWFS